ncbi:MAG: ATP-binding protein [Firmicutes bacterium HGW-Firmicutes-1]|jgi:two-component system chemotaxis sensor kinase CheA|nr:MAG: ATP-binding protein [Firmicutes bacterium HGW-Firmicutes-1]
MLDDNDFVQSFVEEARVHVETVETELMQLDLSNVNDEAINNIFRAVHSIKGTSGFLDLTKIVKLSHSMENIFGEIRSGKMKINDGMIDILLSANDCMKTMVDDVKSSEEVEISEFLDKLSTILSGQFSEKVELTKTVNSAPNTLGSSVFAATEVKKQKIQDSVGRGHKIYRIKKSLEKDLIQNDITLIQFIQQVGSYGTVIDCSVDMEGLLDSGDETQDVGLEFLFTTVLEKDLLSMALNLSEEDICEMNPLEEEEKPVEMGKEEPPTQVPVENVVVVAHEEGDKEVHTNKGQSIVPEDSIRVNVMLLNDLLNLASEMVLAKNQLLRSIDSHRKSIPGIEPIFQNINHITTNLQEKIMQTRMQPIAIVFNKFPRIIRELSKKLGKDIHLEMEGIDVELDKSIIEALGDPLTHLIRNAVDHGLELPDAREKQGKKRVGSVTLKAYHEGGYVNIDIIDDGKGIDIEYIKEKALSKGFVDKFDIATMGDQDILKLLFKPGFSTAEIVTDISGRGVGMDVVKTNIEKLGGTIEIFTVLHVGTTFRLLLPLTLAIIPSLIVESENQKFALPQVNLQEIVRIKASDPARRIEYINNAEVLRLRDKLLPIVHLSEVLGMERTFIDQNTGERVEEKRRNLFHSRRVNQQTVPKENDLREIGDRRQLNNINIVRILVIKIGSRRLGLAVDAIHGSEEILVKTLPVYVKDCKCYSGVTILGDGKTSMILDPSGIIEKANLHYFDGMDEKNLKDVTLESENMRETQNLLLFQCSGPETLALNMAMVSRVEEIKAEDIDKIGDKEYIKFRGESLRVVRPEDFIPITNQKSLKSKYYVIIPKLVGHPMGILIEKIQDTVQAVVHIKQDDNITEKGLIGSTILNNTIILLVNIYELFEKANPEHYKVETTIKKGVKMNILLVEDTPFFQKLEKSYLEDAGYNVHLSENGKEAMEFLQTEKVDAVVSDIVMPIMNGLELVRKIRANPALNHLPVIAITSLTGESQIKEGMKAGFDAYEFKLDRQKLLDILEQAIQKRSVEV